MHKLLLIGLLSFFLLVGCNSSRSNEENKNEKQQKIENSGRIISIWSWNDIGVDAKLVLTKGDQEDDLLMVIKWKDGSKSIESLKIAKTEDGRTKYTSNNDQGEYYIIESNGNLGMYSVSDGKFYEAEKIQ